MSLSQRHINDIKMLQQDNKRVYDKATKEEQALLDQFADRQWAAIRLIDQEINHTENTLPHILENRVNAKLELMQHMYNFEEDHCTPVQDTSFVQYTTESYALALLHYACRLTYRHLLHCRRADALGSTSSYTLRVVPEMPYIEGLADAAEWEHVLSQHRYFFSKSIATPTLDISKINIELWQHELLQSATGAYCVEITPQADELSVVVSL